MEFWVCVVLGLDAKIKPAARAVRIKRVTSRVMMVFLLLDVGGGTTGIGGWGVWMVGKGIRCSYSSRRTR